MLPKPPLTNNYPAIEAPAIESRIGLIGVSVRAAAEAIGPNLISQIRDVYCDWDTEKIAPNRCQTLSLQDDDASTFGANKPVTKWMTTGGLDLDPKWLAKLQLPPNHCLGFPLSDVRFCKSVEHWTDKLRQAGFSILDPQFQTVCPPGRWHFKKNWPESSATWFWQPHVEGELGSAVFLSINGNVELVGCSRLFVCQDWRYQGNVANHDWPGTSTKNQLKRLATVLIEDLQSPGGLFGIDFILGDQLWPLEINPRATASVEVLAGLLRRNLYQEHAQVCWPDPGNRPNWTSHDENVDSTQRRCQWFAKRIVYNSDHELRITEGIFTKLQQLNRFQPTPQDDSELPVGVFRTADIPHPGTLVPAHEPICTILFQSHDSATENSSSTLGIWNGLGKIAWEVVLSDVDHRPEPATGAPQEDGP